jgi:hypothetical protein
MIRRKGTGRKRAENPSPGFAVRSCHFGQKAPTPFDPAKSEGKYFALEPLISFRAVALAQLDYDLLKPLLTAESAMV